MAKKKVGIDIGHGENTFQLGGKGVYKGGKGYEEHHFNSAVGLIVKRRLEELGFETLMAQPAYKNDVPLSTRTRKYNNANCDIVISIHANAGASSANGACAFYWHTSSQSKKLATTFVKNFKDMVDGVGTHGNGLHASKKGSWTNLHMCRETAMPAILVECGFMTNSNDFEYIFGSKKETYIPQVAEAIVKTVCDYFGVKYQKETNSASTDVPKPSQHVSGNYKIERGDTMYSIAQKYGISLQELMKSNPDVNPHALQVGSYLYVPLKDKPKGDQKTNSLVDYLTSIGQPTSFAYRTKLAARYNIHDYKGTSEQNTTILRKLRGH